MGKQFNRDEILERFKGSIKNGRPLLAACTGTGLVAKSVEIGGADVIMLINVSAARHKGLSSLAVQKENPVDVVKAMFTEQFTATKDIPITGGIGVGYFPADGDLSILIDSFMDMGFSGIIDYPTAASGEDTVTSRKELTAKEIESMSDTERQAYEGIQSMKKRVLEDEKRGVGFSRELEMIRLCHKRNIFTMAYAWTVEQAKKLAEAGLDCICAHCGGTTGGLAGFKTELNHADAAKQLQIVLEGAKKVNPDIILLGHGGPFSGPDDTKHMYELTDAVGFVAGSSVDRIPIEMGVMGAVKKFKAVNLVKKIN